MEKKTTILAVFRRQFRLIELLVVIPVISMLAACALPQSAATVQEPVIGRVLPIVKSLSDAIQRCSLQRGPTNDCFRIDNLDIKLNDKTGALITDARLAGTSSYTGIFLIDDFYISGGNGSPFMISHSPYGGRYYFRWLLGSQNTGCSGIQGNITCTDSINILKANGFLQNGSNDREWIGFYCFPFQPYFGQ